MRPEPASPLSPSEFGRRQLEVAERAVLLAGCVLLVLGAGLVFLAPHQAPVVRTITLVQLLGAAVVLVTRRYGSLQLRVVVTLVFIHVTCWVGLFHTGPLTGVGAGVTAATIGAARFGGWRGALVSMACTVVVLLGCGWAYMTGHLPHPEPLDAHWDDPSDWLRIGGTSAVVALFVGLTFSQVAGQFEQAWARAAEASKQLKKRREERKRREEALAVVARDEALGRLAGGVAHDVNNALAVMLTNAQLLQDALPDGSEDKALADEMVAAAKRAAETTRGLLMLGRSQLEPDRTRSAADVCEAVVDLLRRTAPESVTILFERSGSWVPKLGSRAQEQLLRSYVLDALEHLGASGVLTVKVMDAEVGTVRITVEAVRSTEPPSSGRTSSNPGSPRDSSITITDGLLERAGGQMTTTASAHGTLTTISLPADAPLLSRSSSGLSKPAPAERVRRLLLVDDEEIVRRTMLRLLQRAGFFVLTAEDGESATRVFEAESDIDLLVTDAVMPNTDTGAMIRAFQRRHPKAPVIVCSGYVKEDVIRHGVAVGEYAFIQKPFAPDEFVNTVTGALGDGGAP
ncbi:MAG: response regulator [Polyangiaceae bacterium]